MIMWITSPYDDVVDEILLGVFFLGCSMSIPPEDIVGKRASMGESEKHGEDHEQGLPSRATGSTRTRSDHDRDSLV